MSLTSWWVDSEIERALRKEQQLMKERKERVSALIPLNLDGYVFDGWQSGKKAEIAGRFVADFRGWDSANSIFEKQSEQVVRALRTDGGREAPPEPKL